MTNCPFYKKGRRNLRSNEIGSRFPHVVPTGMEFAYCSKSQSGYTPTFGTNDIICEGLIENCPLK